VRYSICQDRLPMAAKDEHQRWYRASNEPAQSEYTLRLEVLPNKRVATHQACSGHQDDRPGPTGGVGDLIHKREEETSRVIDKLTGQAIPPRLLLASSQGEPVELGHFATRSAVIYMYPGSPSSPDGGEGSPMFDAAQHRAFGFHEPDMSALNLSVLGVSSQSPEIQRESAEATRVRHRLLSDPNLLLAQTFELPTFDDRGARWYRRLTMVIRRGRIDKVFYPVASPARNPAQVVAWAKVQAP
jgi:peroxiredoxin